MQVRRKQPTSLEAQNAQFSFQLSHRRLKKVNRYTFKGSRESILNSCFSLMPTVTKMPLCQYCSRLAPDWLIPDIYDKRGIEKPKSNLTPEHRWTHSSWAELLDAAKSCDLCSLIVQESKMSKDWQPYWKPDRKGIRIQSVGLTRLEVVCAEEHRVTKLRFAFDAGESPPRPRWA